MLNLGPGWCVVISIGAGFLGVLGFAIFFSCVGDEYNDLPIFGFNLTKADVASSRRAILILGLLSCALISLSLYGIKFACTRAQEVDRTIIELYNQPRGNKKSEVLYEGVEVPKSSYYDFVVRGKNGGQDILEVWQSDTQIYYDDISEAYIEKVEYEVKNVMYKYNFEKYYVYLPLRFKEA